MDDIIKYGKQLFGRYYGGEISLEDLENELMAKAPILSHNDFAVLGCYCETDRDTTLMLHKVQNIKMSNEMLTEDGISLKMAFMLLCNEIDKSAKSLDKYFSCYKFTPMVVATWKKSWGDRWPELIAEGDQAVKKLPFLKPILDTYLK